MAIVADMKEHLKQIPVYRSTFLIVGLDGEGDLFTGTLQPRGAYGANF